METEAETAVVPYFGFCLDHFDSIPAHLGVKAGAAQGMAGITLEYAAHGNVLAGQIEFFTLVESEGVGGKLELVHGEVIGIQSLAFGNDAQAPGTTPAVCRYGERAGEGAEDIGLALGAGHFVVFGIVENGFHLASGHHLYLFGHAALEHYGLEAQGVAGTVCALVLVNIGTNAAFLIGLHFLLGIINPHNVVVVDGKGIGAHSKTVGIEGLGGERVIDLLVAGNLLLYLGGQKGETVLKGKILGNHGLVVLLQEEGYPVQGFACLGVGHIDVYAAGIFLHGR